MYTSIYNCVYVYGVSVWGMFGMRKERRRREEEFEFGFLFILEFILGYGAGSSGGLVFRFGE